MSTHLTSNYSSDRDKEYNMYIYLSIFKRKNRGECVGQPACDTLGWWVRYDESKWTSGLKSPSFLTKFGGLTISPPIIVILIKNHYLTLNHLHPYAKSYTQPSICHHQHRVQNPWPIVVLRMLLMLWRYSYYVEDDIVDVANIDNVVVFADNSKDVSELKDIRVTNFLN